MATRVTKSLGRQAALAATILTVRAVRRRGKRLAGEPVDVRPAKRPWDRLLSELAQRGWRRRPSQTATEFAAYVASTGGTEFQPIVELAALQQASRFGGRALSGDDESRIEAFRASVAARE